LVLFTSRGQRTVIRLSKLADYGIVIATHLARYPDRQQTAPEVAAATSVPQPMTSKILKQLVRGDILISHRGARGGYGLAKPAEAVSVARVIEALDGPIAITSCIDGGPHDCGIMNLCPARANWQRINGAIREALEGVTLAEMAHGIPAAFLFAGEREAAAARV
jgi:FeS assembly SUF system regulator